MENPRRLLDSQREFLRALTWPIVILALLSLIVDLTGADLWLSRLFFSPSEGWFLSDDNPWSFLYHYGMIPAFLLAFAGLLIFGASFFSRRYLARRRAGLFLVLLLLIAPGLVVNVILKDHWGRPRPADTVEFGGQFPYQPFWAKGPAGQGKSFPSGHASVGFALLAPFFIHRKTAPVRAAFWLAGGMGFGLFMGLGRVVQGGHYLSDVIWSGGLVYLTGLILARLLLVEETGQAGGRPGIGG